MNVEFLIVALVIGRAVDWIFQSQNQAENKTKNIYYLFTHSINYSFLTLIMVGLLLQMKFTLPPLIILFISHMIIDNRTIVKRIMIWKGLIRHQVPEYKWLELGIDQRLHDVVILLIALVI